MSLGASRVAGNSPDYESFRYELWKDLIENGWTFDYIGTQSDDASHPTFNNNNFDSYHQERGNWNSRQILDGLNNWLNQKGSPDIALFSTPGGNDILKGLDYNQTISNINAIIDVLQVNNPNVTIVIEQPAQGSSDFMTAEYINAFNQIKQDVGTFASEKSTTCLKVIAVDMFTGFTDSYLADEVHYNKAGADFIASRYYTILESILEKKTKENLQNKGQ